MVTPSTSLGSMSLVNCRRWKPQATARASDCASVVLPTPGTSSINRWPRASRQTSESRTTSGFPRIADCTARSSSPNLESNCGAKGTGGTSMVSRCGIQRYCNAAGRYAVPDMPVLISLLRGVNVGGHRKVKMDDLRALYESLGFEGVQTYINSGNVIFKTSGRDMVRLRKRIEDATESACGFRSDVILRTPADLQGVIARNPFAPRPAMDASRLAIHFLGADPSAAAREQVRAIDAAPEELHIDGRELY